MQSIILKSQFKGDGVGTIGNAIRAISYCLNPVLPIFLTKHWFSSDFLSYAFTDESKYLESDLCFVVITTSLTSLPQSQFGIFLVWKSDSLLPRLISTKNFSIRKLGANIHASVSTQVHGYICAVDIWVVNWVIFCYFNEADFCREQRPLHPSSYNFSNDNCQHIRWTRTKRERKTFGPELNENQKENSFKD
jgi:hypothetical protein